MTLKKVYQLNLCGGFLITNLDPNHKLVILSEKIDWERLTDSLESFFSKYGRKSKTIRLMVGLHILKHLYNLSDETVTQQLEENLYFRFFCGVHEDLDAWQSRKVLDASTMTNFRKRIGAEGMRLIEEVFNSQLLSEKRINTKTQIVDTTAMEKNVAYPTDSNLLDKGRKRIVSKIKKLQSLGLSVQARSFARLARKQILKIVKLGRGRKERIVEGTTELMKYAQQVIKAVPVVLKAVKKKCSESTQKVIQQIKDSLVNDTELLKKVINQAALRLAGQKCKEKILSMHEPNVVVIAKGKRSKRYEFGSKISLSIDNNGYILGHQEYNHNIADVNTLAPAIQAWQRTYGDYPDELAADRGYQSSNITQEQSMIRRVAIPTRGKKRHPDAKKHYFRRLQKKRNCIEPIIGHLKTDHRMNKCRYSGMLGDIMNVSWATIAWNQKKWAKDILSERQKAP
jgi:transposase, IS5 family